MKFVREGPKAFVPMTECVFQGAIEHLNAHVKEILDGVPIPSHFVASSPCVLKRSHSPPIQRSLLRSVARHGNAYRNRAWSRRSVPDSELSPKACALVSSRRECVLFRDLSGLFRTFGEDDRKITKKAQTPEPAASDLAPAKRIP